MGVIMATFMGFLYYTQQNQTIRYILVKSIQVQDVQYNSFSLKRIFYIFVQLEAV